VRRQPFVLVMASPGRSDSMESEKPERYMDPGIVMSELIDDVVVVYPRCKSCGHMSPVESGHPEQS